MHEILNECAYTECFSDCVDYVPRNKDGQRADDSNCRFWRDLAGLYWCNSLDLKE
jgi:hypothetical protein